MDGDGKIDRAGYENLRWPRRRAHFFRLRGILWCTIGFAVNFTSVSFLLNSKINGLPSILQYIMPALCLIGALVGGRIFWHGTRLHLNARRELVTPLSGAADLSSEPFVLYLRPFADDERRSESENVYSRAASTMTPLSAISFLTSGKTEEEQLVDVLGPLGSVVTVGSPSDSRPPAGAKRIYLRQGDWRKQVAHLIEQARFVVVSVGCSEGALWELLRVLYGSSPERFVLIVTMGPKEYNQFRVIAEDRLRNEAARLDSAGLNSRSRLLLPQYDMSARSGASGIKGIIYYGSDWSPFFVSLDPIIDLAETHVYSSLEAGLRPLFRRLIEYEEAKAASIEPRWPLGGDSNWYYQWSRGTQTYVFVATLAVCASFALSGLFGGFRSYYQLALMVVPVAIGARMGATSRRNAFPWSRNLESGPVNWACGIVSSVSAFVAIEKFLPEVSVSVVFIPIFIWAACFCGFAITSIESLFDSAIAGVAGFVVGQIYGIFADDSFGGHVFERGLQVVVTVVTSVGIAGYLFKRRPGRIRERIGVAEAGVLGVSFWIVYLGATLGSHPLETLIHPRGSGLYVAMMILGALILLRLCFGFLRCSASEKFRLLAGLAVVAASVSIVFA